MKGHMENRDELILLVGRISEPIALVDAILDAGFTKRSGDRGGPAPRQSPRPPGGKRELSATSSPSALLATAEVAEMFKLSPKTLRNWRCLQVGPPFVKHRGRVYYHRADIEVYAKSLPLA